LNDKTLSDLAAIHDDGFAITTAEPWVKHKVQLIRQYLGAFVTALANQVDEVVVVDLFSRNGLYCLGARKDIFAGIPLMVLQQDLPISKYVFCESDPEQARILKIRVNKYFKKKNIVLLQDKEEELVNKIKMYVSEPRKNHKVATLCIADAFGLEPGLETLKNLSSHDFTFLIPVAFHLGKKIDYRFYLNKEKEKVMRFLGLKSVNDLAEWRIESNKVFYKQLINRLEGGVQEFGMNSAISTHKLDSGLMEIPTYSMCLFATKYSARAIQHDAISGSSIQFALFNKN
jgi:three-Cys-motif partner protein